MVSRTMPCSCPMISSLLVCERRDVTQYFQPIPHGCDVHSHDTQRFYTGPEKLQTLSLLSVSCSPVAPSSSALFSSTSQYRGTIYVLSALLHSKPHRRTSTHLENSAADSDHAGPYRISVLHPTSLCIGLSKTCVIICRSLSGIQERILVPATQSSTEVPQSNTLGRSHPTSLVANGALSWEVGDQND